MFEESVILQFRTPMVPLTTIAGPQRLLFTKLINIVSLEQSHHKPMWMYDGGPLKLTLGESSGSSLTLEQCVILSRIKIRHHQGYESLASIFWGVIAHCSKGRDEPLLSSSGNLRGPPPCISIGLWWDCSNDTMFISLVNMSFPSN